MTTAVVSSMSAKQAAKLWQLLHSHFVNFERTLEEIIEKRAWEPMGYASFAEAWTAQMSDVTLASEFRPHVVYAYFDDNAPDEVIAASVKGVGPKGVAALRRQKGNGVPAGRATTTVRSPRTSVPAPSGGEGTVVREHLRAKPAPANTLHLQLGVLKLKRFQRIAKKQGRTVEAIALEAVEAAFDGLA